MPHGVALSYPLIAVSVFARQLCLPVPALFFLIAAGALVQQGRLSAPIVIAMSVAGCLAGDLVWFEAGRQWGRHILRVFTGLSDDPKRSSERAHAVFERWGLRSLLIAKFVPGLDGITPPLAGLEGASRRSFIFYDGMGSLLWSSLYMCCGLIFAKEVDRALAVIESSSRILAACILIPFTAFLVWRGLSILKMVRRLRLKQVSPALLHSRLSKGEAIVIIDLLNFQDAPVGSTGIDGAVRIDPSRLRSRAQIVTPAGLPVVLYCSSSAQFRSARVAMSLRRKGIREVWVLEGGLAQWIEEGLPVTDRLLSEEEVIHKFGLQILDRKSPLDRVSRVTVQAQEKEYR